MSADLTPIGCLDSGFCFWGAERGAASCELQASPVFASGDYEVECVTLEGQRRLKRNELEQLMQCRIARHLLFGKERDLRARDTWGMPPPVSPSKPFGNLPNSVEVGCAELLRAGQAHDALRVQHIGLVDGVDVGLGLFVSAAIAKGTWLCEYTGVVELDRGPSDCYAHALPCMEDMVVSAFEYGSVARLINHSDNCWNVEFACVVHENVLHLVCRTVRDISADEQLLANYGAGFWKHREGLVELSEI